MARIRTIKPDFFSSQDLSSLAPETHLLAAGLLCHADDDGYFRAHIGLVKAAVFPLREDSLSIHDMLKQLSEVGFIQLGSASDGKRYGRIVKFCEHQRINRPTPSKIKTFDITWEDSLKPHGALTEHSHTERKGKEGKGITPSMKLPSFPPDFDQAEVENPKPNGKDHKHADFKGLIFKCYSYLNEGELPPWDGSEAKQLSNLIKAKPDLDSEKFHQWLGNYAASENIKPGARPREFLPHISDYASGPLDRFGRPHA